MRDSAEPFTKYMKFKRIHLFTCIQLFIFAALYVIKAIKSVAIAFPLVIALGIPIRLYLLPKIFTQDELILIDGDDDEIKEHLNQRGFEVEANDLGLEEEDDKIEEDKTGKKDDEGV